MNNIFIPAPVLFALDRLHGAGYHAYVVGGCVRDFLMGRTPGDYDVTTSAKPEQTLAVFDDCRVVETGLQHGTVTLVREGMNIEITTYRVDGVYLDGRHPEQVTFTDDLAEDLCRRDFTVNAMAYSPEAGVIDYHDGLADMKNRVISCVGNAEQRFSEDGLRILRALRFSSVLDFTPDDECSAGVRTLAPLLDKISRERIYVELTKLLGGIAAPRILRGYPDIIARILPGLTEASAEQTAGRIERLRKFRETYEILLDKRAADALHYALLFADADAKLCRRLMQSLKPSRDELSAVESVQKYGNAPETFAEKPLNYAVKLLMKAGGDDFPKRIALYRQALGTMDDRTAQTVIHTAEELREAGACVRLAELAVTGGELMPLGFAGPALGKTLNALLDRVMRGELANEREILLNAAEKERNG
ncbi:MAG: polynucleotide adenylyltransferase [Clostridia bacterium]|nr:polynucleotide adenylyltransferase [Clostridia bacterium]